MATSNLTMLVLCVLLVQAILVKADVASDRSECTDQLLAMATCLTYVGGTSKAPTPDCCAGLKQVMAKSPKCLCLLIKDHDDPSLGLKIDPTRAMSLPTDCDVHGSDISRCPTLLNLSPNSPDAKIFNDFAGASHGNSTTSGHSDATVTATGASTTSSSSTKTTTTSSSSSNGGRSNYYNGYGGRRWWLGLVLEVVGGVLFSLS